MKKRIAAIIGLVAVALLLGFARFKGAGAGLRVVMESVPCNAPGCFESISHFNYLYDNTTKVSRVGEIDISSSGTYAAFEDDGKIMLYKRGSGQLKDVTDGKFAIPETFKWNEEKSQLVITYYNDNPNPIYNNHPASTIRLD